jgi:hypothetical protein
MVVREVQTRLRNLHGRVKDRWNRMVKEEVDKMENHRRALTGEHPVWTPEIGEPVEQGIKGNQPGLY